MKKFIFTCFVSAVASFPAFAQDDRGSESLRRDSVFNSRTALPAHVERVRVDALPEAIKQTLEDEEYKGWVINASFHDTRDGRYMVELKNGAKTQRLEFSHEGERITD